MELLREHLTREQQESMDKKGWFLVEGGRTHRTYKIDAKRYAGNICEMDGEKEIASYCVHANTDIPLGDQLLTQALSLRFDEDHIIGKANKTPLRVAS